jgi:general stress protein CsbA
VPLVLYCIYHLRLSHFLGKKLVIGHFVWWNLVHLVVCAVLDVSALEPTPAPPMVRSTLFYPCLLVLWYTRSRQPLAALHVEAALAHPRIRRDRTHIILIVPHACMVVFGEIIENASELRKSSSSS